MKNTLITLDNSSKNYVDYLITARLKEIDSKISEHRSWDYIDKDYDKLFWEFMYGYRNYKNCKFLDEFNNFCTEEKQVFILYSYHNKTQKGYIDLIEFLQDAVKFNSQNYNIEGIKEALIPFMRD